MKKIIFGLIATFGISIVTFGQATLEHSYSSNGWDYDDNCNTFKTQNGLNYFTFDRTDNTLKLYNSNHSLFKTVNIPVPAGYNLITVSTFSDILFNSDNLIEFLVQSRVSQSIQNIILVNENGLVLQDYGNRDSAFIIKGISNDFKLVTSFDGQNSFPELTNYLFDVYSLPGTTLNTVSNINNESSFFGFPNPTENKIAITNNLESGQNATLEVFDINGKRVIQKNVTGGNSEITIDATELSSGVYIYKLNGQTNRFIKR